MSSETLVEAAVAISKGAYFFAKLDIKDAFNSLERSKVAEALKTMGYPAEFVAWVMASTGAKQVRSVKGRWNPAAEPEGLPAGLPRVGNLADSLQRVRPAHRTRLSPGDLPPLQRRPSFPRQGREGRRAVHQLLIWCRDQGLQLKEVSPNQRALSLVQDVRGQTLTYLRGRDRRVR